jgi:hypothetical protein
MWTRTGSAPAPRARRLALGLAGALLLAFALPAAAAGGGGDEVEFYDTLNATEVSLGDAVTLTVQISGGDDAMNANIELPELTMDFEVLTQHRSTSTRVSMGGGQATILRSKVLTVVLQPKRTGTLHIKPVQATVGGRSYRTGEITLKVNAADPSNRRPRAQQQQQQQPDPFAQFFGGQSPFAQVPGALGGGQDDDADPFAGFFGEGAPPHDSDLFVRASLDKKQAYLGEQLTYSIYLYSRVDVSGVENPKFPKLDAFWAEDVESPTNITGDVKTVNGVPYRVFLLKRRALFPLKAGKQTIDPMEVDIKTGLSLFGNGHTAHRAAQGLEVNVLPLPAGAPAGFATSDVGQWRLGLSTNPSSSGAVQTTVGQPVTVDLTLEGQGNLRNLAVPKLPAVRGLRVYDPTTTDKVAVSHGRFGGKRTFEFIVMPEQTGSFEIPAVSFPYFNPQTARYETASTEPLKLEVTAAGGAASAANPGQPGVAANPSAGQNVLGANLARPLHTHAALSDGSAPLWAKGLFVPVLLLPFGLMLGGAVVGGVRRRAGVEDPRKRVRTAQSRARKRFKGAEGLLEQGDAGAYYGAVAKAVNDYLTDKLGFSALGLTRDELGRRLSSAGARPQSVTAVNAVLEACDLGRFAPGSAQGRREVLEQAASAVEALEDQKLRPTSPEARA